MSVYQKAKHNVLWMLMHTDGTVLHSIGSSTVYLYHNKYSHKQEWFIFLPIKCFSLTAFN